MLWNLFFRAMYRGLRIADPLVRWLWRRGWGLDRVVSLGVPGRVSRRERQLLVTLLTVGQHAYLGHPNGPAEWTRNVEAAGGGWITYGSSAPSAESPAFVRAIRLFGGPERDAVIRATWSQQPFPANLVYALARRHVRDVGVYFRITPTARDAPSDAPSDA